MATPSTQHGPSATTTTRERDGRSASTAPDLVVRRGADPATSTAVVRRGADPASSTATVRGGADPATSSAVVRRGADPAVPTVAPVVDVVVPVHNEQRALPDSIRRLHDFLSAGLPFSWRITIADNASTDETPRLAQALARDLPGVTLLTLPEKGRGRALRAAWTQSDAAVRCYMDVDLSTDLRALLPLVAPLVSGHSDIAIGTRLARGSRVVRGPKRELISRSYNRLLHLSLAARFSDAQCGFKAIRADVAARLLPQVADQAWFFDTELLVLAQREGLRIHEVPVDWTDDPDSTVDIARTAIEDLKGIGRLLAASLRTWVFGRRSTPPTAASAGEAVSSRPTVAAAALADHGPCG